MKRLITFIFALTLAIAANAQLPGYSHHSTTVHTPSGTYTVSSTTLGSHTDVRIYEGGRGSAFETFNVSDTLGNEYCIGIKVWEPYEIGEEYYIYTEEYDPSNTSRKWYPSGKVVIDGDKHMRFERTGYFDRKSLYIVHSSAHEYFVDKYIKKLSYRKLDRKYGSTFELECGINPAIMTSKRGN